MALLLAVADAMALVGVALSMFVVGMGHSEPSNVTTSWRELLFGLAVAWIIPSALAVSCYVHARLRMPMTSFVQGLFLVIGAVLATGYSRMLFSLS